MGYSLQFQTGRDITSHSSSRRQYAGQGGLSRDPCSVSNCTVGTCGMRQIKLRKVHPHFFVRHQWPAHNLRFRLSLFFLSSVVLPLRSQFAPTQLVMLMRPDARPQAPDFAITCGFLGGALICVEASLAIQCGGPPEPHDHELSRMSILDYVFPDAKLLRMPIHG